jgi:hypothetical protein
MTPRRQPVPAAAAQLWPPPAEAILNRDTRAGQNGYLVAPSVGRPRLLVPLEVPGAARMLTRHGGTPTQLAARSLLRLLHRSRVAGWLPLTRLSVTPEPAGVEAYLSACLSRPVSIGVLMGPPRANAKPVLQVFDQSGATIAFAKVGSSPLTARLVDNEASALSMLDKAAPRTFTAPRLLHHGKWRQFPVLVQQALPLSQSNLAPAQAPWEVMAEIAELTGIHDEQLGDSGFLARVDPGLETRWHGVDLQPFQRLFAALASAGACPFGSSHGDFGPWNMGTDGSRFEVWDWERFDASVPVGFDAAHYRTQRAVACDVEPLTVWPQIVGDVSRLLDALGRDARSAPAAAGSYLLDICSRYRGDAGDDPTPTLRRRMAWLSGTAAVAARSLEEAFA